MTIDFAAALVEALQHPAVTACLKHIVAAELAKSSTDVWMDQTAAAKYVYGCDGKTAAFHQLRRRNPTLEALSSGTGKGRRFRKSDLDEFIKNRAGK